MFCKVKVKPSTHVGSSKQLCRALADGPRRQASDWPVLCAVDSAPWGIQCVLQPTYLHCRQPLCERLYLGHIMVVAEVLQQLADSFQQVRTALVLVTPVADLQAVHVSTHLATCAQPDQLASFNRVCILQIKRQQLDIASVQTATREDPGAAPAQPSSPPS